MHKILPGLLLTSLALTSCVTTDADRQALQKGYTLYTSRQLDDAEATATKFITANPQSDNLDEAYYLRGISRLTKGGTTNRQAAQTDLKLALEKTKRPDLKAKATRALGDINFDETRWTEAKKYYEQAFDGATPALTTYLNYRIGACLQATGDWDPAQPFFQKVITANNDSYLTERSIARMYAKNFALQFGAFQEGPKAAELITQLKTSTIPAAVVTETREGKLLYIVRSGSYKTWQEADTARDKLSSKFPMVTIVP